MNKNFTNELSSYSPRSKRIEVGRAKKLNSGFTLIEILLVIAAISILASIVIVAINPAKQLAQARNTQRRSDVNTILNAVWQYTIDNDGTLPTAIQEDTVCLTAGTAAVAAKTICATGGTCTGITDLGVLTASEEYLVSMPEDPTTATTDQTKYLIKKSANGRVTVCATAEAEAGTTPTISATR